MKVSMIAAIGKNRELGKDNKIPWHIPEDAKWFREKTSGHVVIMGRKTYESIGHPLPNRVNIIVTRDSSYAITGAIISHSMKEAVKIAKENEPSFAKASAGKASEIFIMGGAQIYEQGIHYADRLYITLIDHAFDADAFFPEYREFSKKIFEQKGQSGEYNFTFFILEHA